MDDVLKNKLIFETFKSMSKDLSAILAMSNIIEFKLYKFVIMHCPDNTHSALTIQKLKEFNIRHVFRLCDNTYDVQPYLDDGITIHDDIKFVDGGIPNKLQIQEWFRLINDLPGEVIAVHCVSGIGRAPVLVGLALIHAGMDPLECIEYVRKYRKRAFNNVQINFLSEYSEKKKKCILQ
eukprot:NODE_120_length_17920_cov_0.559782.p8 type:complete len:179 gc:universal NODE_120_length_17920_cov_0.559782:4707-4171(-)